MGIVWVLLREYCKPCRGIIVLETLSLEYYGLRYGNIRSLVMVLVWSLLWKYCKSRYENIVGLSIGTM